MKVLRLKDLLISLEEQNQNYLAQKESINIDNKLNNVIQATNKLGEIFYKAASKYKFLNDEEIMYSDHQHRGNTGEGQFHINNRTIETHLKKYTVKWLTYEELYNLFT